MKLLSLFSTPILNTLWEDAEGLNHELEQHIRSLAEGSEGLNRSNVGGWHSPLDFLESDRGCVATLQNRLGDTVRSVMQQVATEPGEQHFRLEAWANVLPTGGYHSLHCHPNAAWSGVYYVTGNPMPAEGEHPFSGKLELIDPRPGASLSYSEGTRLYGRFLVNPQAGQLVLFPGWLQHQVHPYLGPGERITIAFNALV